MHWQPNAFPPAPRVLFELICGLPPAVRSQVSAIAIDGTSATAMLVDRTTGKVLAPTKLYNESQGPDSVAQAKVGGARTAWHRRRWAGQYNRRIVQA